MVTRRAHHGLQSDRPKVERRSALVLDQVAHGYVLLDEAVIELADADAVSSIARLVATRVDLPGQTVARALDVGSDESITMLCRAAGLGINAFSAVLRMRRRRRSSDCNPSEALNAFLQMPVEAARHSAGAMNTTSAANLKFLQRGR